jgi:hypothetical protein
MARRIPKDVATIIGGYVMEWTVLPWVLERAPPLIKPKYPYHMILHWHGNLIGEPDNLFGSGVTANGGILVSSWDPEVNDKYKYVPKEDDDVPELYDPDADPYDNEPDYYIWENPRSQDFVRGWTIDWVAIAANPADWALDLLEQLKFTVEGGYPWYNLCRNTNPRARALWAKAHSSQLDWGWLSANPNAIEFLTNTFKYRDPDSSCHISSNFILWNPAAEKFIETEYKVDISNSNICYNSDPWPAAKGVQDKISIKHALNFGYGRNIQSHAISRMREFTEWTPRMRGYLYTNPSQEVLAMIRDNPERFPLAPVIWSNPNIFELTIPPGLIDVITSIEF